MSDRVSGVGAVAVSVVTINYQNAEGLKKTLSSIGGQVDLPVELVIVDGGSVDGSVELAIIYAQALRSSGMAVKISSEPDRGIYDALNKGIEGSTGDYVVLLHSGDTFSSSTTLREIKGAILELSRPDVIYGNTIFVDRVGKVVRRWAPSMFRRWKLFFGWMPPHLSTVISKRTYERVGIFDVDFRIAGDYDFLLRMFLIADLESKRVSLDMVRMAVGGASNKSLYAIIESNREVVRSWKKHRGITPYWVFITKPATKIFQLKRVLWQKFR